MKKDAHTASGARLVLGALGVKLEPPKPKEGDLVIRPVVALPPESVAALELLAESGRSTWAYEEFSRWLQMPRPLYTSSELQAKVAEQRAAKEALRRG